MEEEQQQQQQQQQQPLKEEVVVIEDSGDEGTLVQNSSPARTLQEASKKVQYAIGHFFRGDKGAPVLRGKSKGKMQADKQLVPFEEEATEVVQADVPKELFEKGLEEYRHRIALYGEDGGNAGYLGGRPLVDVEDRRAYMAWTTRATYFQSV